MDIPVHPVARQQLWILIFQLYQTSTTLDQTTLQYPVELDAKTYPPLNSNSGPSNGTICWRNPPTKPHRQGFPLC